MFGLRHCARTALIALSAAASIAFADVAVRPAALAAPAETEQFDTVFKFQFLPEIKKIPSLERIFRDHPEIEAQFRAAARAAYERGGSKGLLEDAGTIGATVLGNAFASYMPRARGEDLMLFTISMAGILGTMNETDPEACILYQHGPNFGRPLESSRLIAAIGRERQRKLLDSMNAVVVNAADKPVAFDDAKATEVFTVIAVKAAKLLTGNSSEVAEGKRLPVDVAEAKAACSFGAALFKEASELEPAKAELALRKMFAPE